MYSKIYTGAISGIDSLIATVEVDVSTGMPTFDMVGLLHHEVREAKERVTDFGAIFMTEIIF